MQNQVISPSSSRGTRPPGPRQFTASNAFSSIVFLGAFCQAGSSQNISQPRIAAFLALSIEPGASFPVLVCNGESLHCSSLCSAVPLTIYS
ncbi:UNVERIFIED_CONTAM: hypothetical protein Sangu_1320800 [Sesamum angustifolium]|uniref:Uncharacterized protein n=1 Tax=Sesamum angustifolium TaxID=2727405 RepID=A0AAW2NNW9_9LAMI